jgi:ABC-type transport system involved in cytochrome bd biosynthesis fused ATPase/permease subunit
VCRIVALVAGIALFGVAGWALGASAGVGGPKVSFGAVVFVLIALSLVKGAARYGEQFAGHLVAFKALARIRVFFYDRLEPQAPAAVEGRSAGDLLSRVTKDVDRVEVFFAHTLAPAVTAVVVPLATTVFVAVAITPGAGIVLAVGLALVGLVVPALGRHTSARAAAMLRRGRGEVAQHVTDSVQGVREVLAFDYAERRLAELTRLERPVARGMGVLSRLLAVRRGVDTTLGAMTLIAQFAVLTWANVPLAQFAEGLAITLAAFAPVLAVEDFAADLTQAYASARRIFEVTDAPALVADPADSIDSVDPPAATPSPARCRATLRAPSVQFRGVRFTYPAIAGGGAVRSEPALEDVSFDVRGGSVTAIVGASGSGKSTVAALLTRSYDPDQGTVLLAGRDVRTMPLDQVRAEVGVSPQLPYLFNDTIEGNLRLARPDADPALLAEAIRRAAFDTVVAEEPDGLAARVGEMGERLSGGQRQRLAVARTLIRQPSVIVLDEATSQLDRETEARVLAGVREAADGATVIVIAHRLATVADAAWIVVLDAGRVVEQGTWQDLVDRGGCFTRLLAREQA